MGICFTDTKPSAATQKTTIGKTLAGNSQAYIANS